MRRAAQRMLPPESHLVTRCPACATAFRASAAQLAARAGQVRCGRCNTVFDALAHALADDVPTAETGQGAAISQAQPPSAEYSDNYTQAMDVEPVHPATESLEVEPEPLVLTHAPSEELPQEISADPALTEQTYIADPNLEFDFGEPRRQTGVGLRLLSWSVTGILFAGLLLQIAFHFRGDIALLFPDTKLALEAACSRMGCTLPLPQRADMMSIESSDLQADTLNPSVMVLTATLRNRAPFAQTPPALELTLTDGQDQPLARRVLTVADYFPRDPAGVAAAIAPETEKAFPSGTELPVKVYFDASAVQPTGYRLYLFYP